jgi:hypothetical protein
MYIIASSHNEGRLSTQASSLLDIVGIQQPLEEMLGLVNRFHRLLFVQFADVGILASLPALMHLGLPPFPSFLLEHHFAYPFAGLDVLDFAEPGLAFVLGLVQTNPWLE